LRGEEKYFLSLMNWPALEERASAANFGILTEFSFPFQLDRLH